MNQAWLLFRSLTHFWRTNLAVVLGVVAGTAVISGALVVGDSVRGSLRQMSLDRLGAIDYALTPNRLFRQDLARRIWARPGFGNRFPVAAPALFLNGTFVAERTGSTRRAGGVQVLGIDDDFWNLTRHGDIPCPEGQEVVINTRLANQLGVKAGGDVSLWMQIPSFIPRETLLGKREGNLREIPLKVRAVLNEEMGAGRFSLSPNQQLPLNAFVRLQSLQESLGLALTRPSRSNPTGSPARVNAIFVSARLPVDQYGPKAQAAARDMSSDVAAALTLSDLNLRMVASPRGYASLESDQQILEDPIVAAATFAAERRDLKTSPVLAYLANELASVPAGIAGLVNAKEPRKFSVYSVVAGVDPVPLKTPPFGPFTWASPVPSHPLGDEEIVVNDWMAADLGVHVGDMVRMRYNVVGSHGELPEEEKSFRVVGIVKLEGAAADPELVPVVKGITDAKSIQDWNQPFPMQLNRVTKRDEEYWNKYRATPKSFVSLQTAQRLWGSPFGSLTSLRVAPHQGQTVPEASLDFERWTLAVLKNMRMDFQPAKDIGVRAAVGSNDFSQLFLGFSFFLILAAAILVGLLFRLGIEQRGAAVGLLGALGFSPGQLRRIYLGEGFVLVVLGALLGTAAAVGYASLMIFGLKHWWNEAIGTQFLSVYVVPSTLAIGFAASAFLSLISILWGLRQLRRLTPRELLAGATEPRVSGARQRQRSRRSLWLGGVLAAVAVCALALALLGKAPSGVAFEGLSWKVVLFFVDGTALLVAGVLLLAGLLDADRSAAVRGRGWRGVARLGIRNTVRHRQRSVTSVALIASATFVIVSVGAGRRNPVSEKPELNSGNGGFSLVAESSEPILFDMNTSEGRDKLDLHADETTSNAGLINDLLRAWKVFAFRVKPGDDASCLNVYQARVPTILGVPKSLIERGGFRFIGSRETNPWTILERTQTDGTIPVIGDANTLQYSLHKEVGRTIAVPNDQHPRHTLHIAGMLDGSVFQGVLLMSEENFRRLYPEIEGYRYFLVDVPGLRSNAYRAAEFAETKLTPYGFYAEPVSDRLANFLAVQNTYLSTFQTLGGLGLLLGTFGLATVMLRNVLERRKELALLEALGFRPSDLGWLVVVETAVLLFCGLLTGTIAALVAMMPHLTSIGADVPWASLASILALVFAVSLLAALAGSMQAARTPVLENLRSE